MLYNDFEIGDQDSNGAKTLDGFVPTLVKLVQPEEQLRS